MNYRSIERIIDENGKVDQLVFSVYINLYHFRLHYITRIVCTLYRFIKNELYQLFLVVCMYICIWKDGFY